MYSNVHLNTLSNLKGLITNNNSDNEIGKALEKSQWNGNQDDKNNKSNELIEFIEDKNKSKQKDTKFNNNSNNKLIKSINTFDYRKNVYNLSGNKNEKTKAIISKKLKSEISLKKLKSNKSGNNSKIKTSSKKNASSTNYLDKILSAEESKIKEDNKESFVNKKNSRIYKIEGIGDSNNINNNNINEKSNFRKSYQNLNINTNNNNMNISKRNLSRSNHKNSLRHCTTKSNLGINRNKQNYTSILNREETMKQLSNKEKSYYILSKSPILRLKERLLFGRSTSNLRIVQSISELLQNNEIILKKKIKELEKRITECDKKIKAVFNASKTAEINFNFILTKDEEEFKNFGWFADNENDRNEYYNYLKIFYILFNENYENIELKNLSNKLYTLINKNGFKTIKEYLYDMFFKKKEIKNIIHNIAKINALLEEDIELNDKFNIKFCRFALFTSFLIREVITYGNDIKNTVELKMKTKEMINVINKKLELYKNSNLYKRNKY